MIKFLSKKNAFTLIELLVVIAIIAALAAIVIIAVNPARQIAQTRNVRREMDIKNIYSATSQYMIDHGMLIPTGVDENLRMIGTAMSGCATNCGEKISQKERIINNISYYNFGIKKASAQSIPPSGWVSPDGYDNLGQWSGQPKSYDNNTGTYAQNEFGSVGWGQFIVLTVSEPISSDRLRINADYLDAHIKEVDVDVLKDGNWVDVFQGGNENDWNCKWVELSFNKGLVNKVRFRYNYKVAGWWYWLYELQFYRSSEETKLPACLTQEASSIGKTVAILNGSVSDDGGEPCQYRFQYGKTINYTNNTDWSGNVSTDDLFSEYISNLSPETTYYFRAQIKNSLGISSGENKEFKTGALTFGWLPPTSHSDPDNKWTNENYAYDGNTATLARSYHNSGDSQWSSFIYFNYEKTFSDRLRFYARAGTEVDQVDVDIFTGGSWQDLYQGSFLDKQWVEKSFSGSLISQIRLRFHAAYASHGFYWELNEIALQKNSETSEEACINLSSYLVPDYLVAIPYDPLKGDDNKTYYAIKKDVNGKIIIKACEAELNKEIVINK